MWTYVDAHWTRYYAPHSTCSSYKLLSPLLVACLSCMCIRRRRYGHIWMNAGRVTLPTVDARRINYGRCSSSHACHACAYDVNDTDILGCALYLLKCHHTRSMYTWYTGMLDRAYNNIVAGHRQTGIHGFKTYVFGHRVQGYRLLVPRLLIRLPGVD